MDVPTAILVAAVIVSLPSWVRAAIQVYEQIHDDWDEKMKDLRTTLEDAAAMFGVRPPTVRVDEDRDVSSPFGGV